LPIRTFGDPVLRRRAAEVGAADDAMRKLMRVPPEKKNKPTKVWRKKRRKS